MRILFTIISLLFFIYSPVYGSSELYKMSKSGDKDSVQVYLSFDQVPTYENKLNGKRLDIILRDTRVSEKTSIFKENDKIVKVLVRPDKNDSEISLFFRYVPQKIDLSTGVDNTLVADIELGNRFTKSYQEFSSRLDGVTILNRQITDFQNPLNESPYAFDWKTFFSSYESPVTITPAIRFHIPDFPSVRLLLPGKTENTAYIPAEALALAKEGAWDQAGKVIEDKISQQSNIEIQKLLALTYGEILLRTGNFEDAYRQLYLLKTRFAKEQTGQMAAYLLSLLTAIHGDPYTADFELRTLADSITRQTPLLPHLIISIAETSLATKQLDQMEKALAREDIGYPEELEYRRELRQADFLYATGKSVKAYVAYHLASKMNDLNSQPYSLNGLCDTLYNHKSYSQAAECYDKLAELVDDRALLGMSYYRAAMARLKYSEYYEDQINDFSRIEDAFAGTEAGFRAALKKTDLRYLSRKDWAKTALLYYRALAEKSMYRAVSEEAYFKEALLYHFAEQNSESIDLLMTFLRNFRSGPVRPSAQALLIQLLPDELKRLINDEDYTAALTLARQNRNLFDNNWVDVALISELGHSYHQLGLYSDALRIYLYLVEISTIEEKEKYILPLVKIFYEKGDFSSVEDYSTQYSYLYPDGADAQEILYLRLKSLLSSEQIGKALTLIPVPLPNEEDFRFLASSIYFRNNQFEDVISAVEPIVQDDKTIPDSQLFMLAESYFQMERYSEAKSLYDLIKDSDQFSNQTLFRLSQIAQMEGKSEQALEMINTLSRSKTDSLWKTFAEKEIQFQSLNEKL